MNYKIVFSIPIHERLEVVVDQIINFFNYNPDCAIVFHFSQGFNYDTSSLTKDEFLKISRDIGNVYINSESVRTGLGDIIQAHLSNFKFVDSLFDFEYYCMSASNELFIKPGLYNYIKNFTCGYRLENPESFNSWRTGKTAQNDTSLMQMLAEYNSETVCGSQIEGSFYSRDLYRSIVSVIERYYDFKTMEVKYPRDEIYFASIVEAMSKASGNHRIIRGDVVTFVPWDSYTMNVKIRKIIKLQQQNNYIFCVKRVPRVLNDCVRQFLRSQGKYVAQEKKYLNNLLTNNTIYLLFLEKLRELSIINSGIRKKILKSKKH